MSDSSLASLFHIMFVFCRPV